MLVASRTPEQLREHYEIERALADRLRQAPATVRGALYALVYDELFRRIPHHPQLRAREDPEAHEHRARDVRHQLGFLSRFFTPRTTFMEIGAGDCALSVQASGYVERVYAVDVSEELLAAVRPPSNLRLLLSDGVSVPVPEGSIDLALSDQLMEHLHPEDARQQLRNIHRSLRPAGVYLCVTPNRLYGPTDVSGYFDEVASGLHLREYSAGELRALLRECGFSRLVFYAGARGVFIPVPYMMLRAAEAVLDWLPGRWRKRVARQAPLRALLGVRVAAYK
jgi:SAM-dependent methyltransferase